MSTRVTDFKWEKGKNDLEYIALLEKNLDVMLYKFRECSKFAKEQYNKGRESAFKEIAYSDGFIKESKYEQGKEDLKADIKKASVVMNGEKTYGSNMKIILLTEEKYNEIFGQTKY